MSIDSHRSIPDNPNPDLRNRGLCSTNRPIPGQPACSFSEQAYKLWSRPAYREGLLDNPEQDKEQKKTEESLESLYRRAKTEIGRETERMDLTELLYPTTRLGKAEGPSSLERQRAKARNQEKERRRLRLSQKVTRLSYSQTVQRSTQSGKFNVYTALNRQDRT